MKTVDLHVHSNKSDGSFSPAGLVDYALEKGLSAFALTDHDTLAGVETAVKAGETLGLRVLRGIEIGAAEDENLHILGYGVALDSPVLTELCETFKAGRDERKFRILDYLRANSFELTLEEVEELRRMERRALPPDADYASIQGLRLEAREKLNAVRPLNLGQAARISGVSPADIAALMIWLEK